ncbi:MAG: radical SAM family heme chaperone HemW, partial [Clostridia bacterium]|nr:radical SAM family heme chaperone HemW [Clostridia bacterium]
LYVHIPFCRSKCLYCDFCSCPRQNEEKMVEYVSALFRDLKEHAPACRAYTVDTVFLGGGTPTTLPAYLLKGLMEEIYKYYNVAPNAEITAECNPITGQRELFARMRAAGINRLSIGLQSAHEKELKALGRLHSFDTFATCFADARAAGFDNISVDVMSGIPYQTPESRKETLQKVLALGPEHISSYDLIIEAGTPFARKRATLSLPDEEAARQMYLEGIAFLAENGYTQYEISNFAKPGFESRHNLKYWNCAEYLGFGVAAYSDFGGVRFGNSRDMEAYIAGLDITEEKETPDKEERVDEYVMLRFRLCEGVDVRTFEERFGISFEETYGKKLIPFVSEGLVCKKEGRYFLLPKGMLVSNMILSEILKFDS